MRMKPKLIALPATGFFLYISYSHIRAKTNNTKGGLKYMKLVIAEKPSVAQSIAKVLGANERKDSRQNPFFLVKSQRVFRQLKFFRHIFNRISHVFSPFKIRMIKL